mgnify:CR=1 FL=1
MDTQVDIPSDRQIDIAVETFKILSDPTRLRIVWALLHGEHSVNNLADHVDARPEAVSQHLAKLRLAGLVRKRRDGTHIYYQAQNNHVLRLVQEALSQARHNVLGLDGKVDVREVGRADG